MKARALELSQSIRESGQLMIELCVAGGAEIVEASKLILQLVKKVDELEKERDLHKNAHRKCVEINQEKAIKLTKEEK